MKYEHRILWEWPGKLRNFNERDRSPFKVDWMRTLLDLEREAREAARQGHHPGDGAQA